jgi:hypothetical protein
VTPLTAHFYNQGFDRVMPLVNGDYLLTGPRAVDPKDPWKQRHTGFEMFVLDRSLTTPPVPLGERLDIAANEKLVGDAARTRDVAGKANDAESQDLMIGRITLHQKTIWMLKSFLMGQPLGAASVS